MSDVRVYDDLAADYHHSPYRGSKLRIEVRLSVEDGGEIIRVAQQKYVEYTHEELILLGQMLRAHTPALWDVSPGKLADGLFSALPYYHPLEKMPMYINDKFPDNVIAAWRLKIGH